MKIAIVYDPIYPYVIGGAEKRNREFAQKLSENGHEIFLVGMQYWTGKDRVIENGVNLVGICKETPLYGRAGKRRIYEAVRFAINVFFHLIKNSYDVVDCGNIPFIPALFAWVALKFKKTKFVITWHEVWGLNYWFSYSGPAGVFGWLAEAACSKITPNNITNSLFTKEKAQQILGMDTGKLTVIPNAIDYRHLSTVKADKRNQIVYAGRLIKHKRVEVLIEAFAAITAGRPKAAIPDELVLKIVGDGPDKNYLKGTAEKLNVADRVEFTGFLGRDELAREIKRSQIFVLPSDREGFAIVVIEAMALGVPVIAKESEYSAVKTIINDGTDGFMFKDKEGLIKALNALLSDTKLRDRVIAGGRETAAKYDIDAVVIPSLIEYYKSI